MKTLNSLKERISLWAREKFLQISIFNIVIILLFMLRSAGYFYPYFLISINLIVVVALIMGVLLLGARSRTMFVVSLLFWIFAALMRILNLDPWAERTAIYTFEALAMGLVLLIFEAS